MSRTATIRVDPQELRDTAAHFHHSSAEIERITIELCNAAAGLDTGCWPAGEAARMMARIAEADTEGRRLARRRAEMGDMLMRAADAFERADMATVQASMGLSPGSGKVPELAKLMPDDAAQMGSNKLPGLASPDASSYSDSVPPIRKITVPLSDGVVLDMVRYPPGVDGIVDTGKLNDVGILLDQVGVGLGIGQAIVNLLEIFLPPGVDEIAATLDLAMAVVASICQGETYYGVPHPDLPPMVVVGQDVFVAAADLAIGVVADALGAILAVPTDGVGIVAGEVVDWVTSGYSLLYNIGRTINKIPTEGAIGFYKDEQGTFHIVLLDYVPAKNGEETISVGKVTPIPSLKPAN